MSFKNLEQKFIMGQFYCLSINYGSSIKYNTHEFKQKMKCISKLEDNIFSIY